MTGTLNLRAHEELLLEVVRAERDPARISDLLSRSDFEWEAFWELAGAQQVQPLAASVMADRHIRERLPDTAQREMKTARLRMTLSNMSNQAEFEAIVARLGEQGIPAVPLKGTQLARRLFGTLDARRCGDIDILVREDDWDAARRVLMANGYRPTEAIRPGIREHMFHGVPLTRHANGRPFTVEIHRQITDPRFLTIDHDALWQRIARREIAPGDLLDIPTNDLLVFLAVHAPKHSTGTLRLLADIDHVIAREGRQLDWDRAVAIARDWRADAILYFVLTLCASLLSTPIPQDVLRQIQPPSWKRVAVPFLVGPKTVLQPPAPPHLLGRRFRIAYCLMLRGGGEIRSYWHYIMMPPQSPPRSGRLNLAQNMSRPVDGLIWTARVIWSALRDRYRPRISTQS